MAALSTRVLLFLSSYCPFFLIFALLSWGNGLLIIALISALVGIISAAGAFLYLGWCRRRLNPDSTRLTEVTRRDGDVMSYIASYLLPFVTATFTSWQQLVALLAFLTVLAIVYVNSNLLYVNPLLSICGYHLYEIQTEQGHASHFYIARRHLFRGDKIDFVRIGDNTIFLEC